MASSGTIYFYADGGESIGYGHIIRTWSLAEVCLDHGWRVEYVSATPESVCELIPNRIAVTPVESHSDFISTVKSDDVDILVSDSYDLNHGLQEQLSTITSTFAPIMDRNPHLVCCDALINGNLYASGLEYDWTGDEPKWCLGADYVLLRNRIREMAINNPPWRHTPERALVTMGGSDVKDLTPTIVSAFDGFDIQLDVIVGPGFSEMQEQEIRTIAKEVSTQVSVVRNPDDLPMRLFQADFAVNTSSTTIYELLALGTPSVSLSVVENQEPIAKALRDRDLAIVLDSNIGEETVRTAILQYFTDPSLRKNRRDLGRKLVDGKGTERVFDALLSITP